MYTKMGNTDFDDIFNLDAGELLKKNYLSIKG